MSPYGNHLIIPEKTSLIQASLGRGSQLDAGAKAAKYEHLFFFHVDSLLDENELGQKIFSLYDPEKYNYFDLTFYGEKNLLTYLRLTEKLVKFRSDKLGIPFGDQGLALSKTLYHKTGGFIQEEQEDHRFLWRVRQKGVSLNCLGKGLSTSPVKYQRQGWLRLSIIYQLRTYKVALPEFLKLICLNLRRKNGRP